MKPGAVFYKMSGSGNDFIVFDGRYNRLEEFTSERVRAVCERRRGIGADGVILLEPATSADVHFVFHYWNSDGSEGPMCGNGALCATRLASLIELAPEGREVRFATAAGIHRGTARGDRAEIQLPDCAAPVSLPGASIEPEERLPTLATPSVPHLVLLVDDVAAVDLERRGPPLRHDPAIGPGGANVNWVSAVGDGSFRMRTYERGVEGETLACGTGAVACALSLEHNGLARPGVRLWTSSRLPLDVRWHRERDCVTSISLQGEGRLVFRGIIREFPTLD
jgi:diaminopimelate epimerase